jgi:hypothetical protein
MGSLLRSLFGLFSQGAESGGSAAEGPVAPTDVTLGVPGMN